MARAWSGPDATVARRLALLGRHLLPAMIVLQHVLALGGRKSLDLMIALKNFLALLGRQLPEVRVGLAYCLRRVDAASMDGHLDSARGSNAPTD